MCNLNKIIFSRTEYCAQTKNIFIEHKIYFSNKKTSEIYNKYWYLLFKNIFRLVCQGLSLMSLKHSYPYNWRLDHPFNMQYFLPLNLLYTSCCNWTSPWYLDYSMKIPMPPSWLLLFTFICTITFFCLLIWLWIFLFCAI